MNPGKYNKLVEIQSKTQTTGDYGGTVDSWSKLYTVWAEIKPMKGRELISAKAVQSEITTRFNIRYILGITGTMRIVFEGKYYDIQGDPIDPDMKHEELQLLTKSGVVIG